jgi:hypothetical protein
LDPLPLSSSIHTKFTIAMLPLTTAFRIEAGFLVVPEPSTLAAGALSLVIGLGVYRKKAGRGYRFRGYTQVTNYMLQSPANSGIL